jgi:hypothetical protein
MVLSLAPNPTFSLTFTAFSGTKPVSFLFVGELTKQFQNNLF